jgi:hypothetical protein
LNTMANTGLLKLNSEMFILSFLGQICFVGESETANLT